MAATELEMEVRGAEVGQRHAAGFIPVLMDTTRGPVALRHYPAPGAHRAVVLVGGIGGGWDTPGRDLYGVLGSGLPASEMAVVWGRLRRPTDLAESVLDVMAAIAFAMANGALRLGLVGHASGGAAVLQAAAACPAVRAVVTLATQAFGGQAAGELDDGCAVLSVHGGRDQVLGSRCSEEVQRQVPGSRRLVVLDDAGHALIERANEVEHLVRDWLVCRVPAA